jgi:hypothetical protein
VWGLLSKYLNLRDEIRNLFDEKEYKKSKNSCLKYIELLKSEVEESTKDTWFCYFMLAKNCMYLKDQEALMHIFEALRFAQLTGSLSNYQSTLQLKVRVYEELYPNIPEMVYSLYEENRLYLLQLLNSYDKFDKHYEKYEILLWLSLDYNNMAYILSGKKENYKKSEEYYINAMQIREEVKNNNTFDEYDTKNLIKKLDNTYYNLCDLYLKYDEIPYMDIYKLINKVYNKEVKQELLDKVLTAKAVDNK